MSKTIMVSDQAYAFLTRIKNKDESYTDVILRYFEEKESKRQEGIMACAGALKDILSEEEFKTMENIAEDIRKSKLKVAEL